MWGWCEDSIEDIKKRCERRKKQKQIYLNKGCTEQKAESLLFRYMKKWY